jgi:hypothetical protein
LQPTTGDASLPLNRGGVHLSEAVSKGYPCSQRAGYVGLGNE